MYAQTNFYLRKNPLHRLRNVDRSSHLQVSELGRGFEHLNCPSMRDSSGWECPHRAAPRCGLRASPALSVVPSCLQPCSSRRAFTMGTSASASPPTTSYGMPCCSRSRANDATLFVQRVRNRKSPRRSKSLQLIGALNAEYPVWTHVLLRAGCVTPVVSTFPLCASGAVRREQRLDSVNPGSTGPLSRTPRLLQGVQKT